MLNLFGKKHQEENGEKPDTDDLEQYKEDFKAFMEKSHLQFSGENQFKEGYFVGYTIRPNKTGIWLYALILPNMIAGGLRVLEKKNFEILEHQKSDIQPYFVEHLEWKGNRVGINRLNIDTTDIADRGEQFYFLRKTLETLDLAFRDRVANLD